MNNLISTTKGRLLAVAACLLGLLVLFGMYSIYTGSLSQYGSNPLAQLAAVGASTIEPIVVEAEAGALNPPMVSGGSFISTSVNKEGSASYVVNIPEAGDYVVQFLVRAPTKKADAIELTVDGGKKDSVDFYVRGQESVFEWKTDKKALHEVALTAGTHLFVINGKDASTEIDAFRLLKKAAPEKIWTS